jgi:hypothetical protein
MFQDSAGTTPVTAVEQPVGLILDKSKGLALGSELITNGDFSGGATGWTVGTNWAITGGGAVATAALYNTDNLDQSVTLTSGRTYKLTFNITAYTAGSLRLDIPGVQSIITGSVSATGAYTYYFVAGAGGARTLRFTGSTGPNFTGTIDNISVRELPGNHASQSTSASRPVLSARVNLLTYSEQFDNAAWAKVLLGSALAPSVASTNSGTDPLGTSTADRVQFSLNGNTASGDLSIIRQSVSVAVATYTFSIWLRSFDSNSYVMTISAGTVEQFITVTPTWQLFTVAATIGAAGAVTPGVFLRGARTTANSNTADILMWGADYRPTNDGVGIPAYQRVAAATDYDTSGFPLYLKFDGTDDSLSTASIDFSATDKMNVFAGIRKLSDANIGILLELSASVSANNGTFRFSAPHNTASATYQFSSRGTIERAPISPTDYAAPVTNVIVGLGDISGDTATLRINGSQVAETLTDQGTGNYGNYPLFIGSRNSASLRLNARLYSLIIRGAQSTDAQIASTEAWVNGKTKAY